MTQEDKELLLKDICARLPYGVVVRVVFDDKTVESKEMGIGTLHDFMFDNIDDIQPYLRPMSSMTEEDYKEWHYLYLPLPHKNEASETERRIDWLNAHHFDYRGLIPMGLALEAPEGMYKTK